MSTEVKDGPRVLMIDHSAEPGGGQLGLLRYLENRPQLRVDVVFLTGGALAERFRCTGSDITVLDGRPFALSQVLGHARRLGRFLRSAEYDLLVANSLYSALALALTDLVMRDDAPHVYYSRVAMSSLQGWRRTLAMNAIFPRFDGFLANSKWTALCIPDRLHGERLVAYPVCGIGPDVIPVGRAAPCSSETIRIATLSRPDPWKGIDLVIEATSDFANVFPGKEISLDVFGGDFFSDSTYSSELDAAAANSSITVRRHGHVDQVLEHMRSLDIIVVPTRQPEPFGQVAAQALSQGCVVVASDEGGLLEIVSDHDNGLLFSSRNVTDLRRAIMEPIINPTLAAAISRRAIVSAEKFWDQTTVRMLTSALLKMVDVGRG